MPFRLLTPEEKRETAKEIRDTEQRVTILQRYLRDLKLRLGDGKWTSVEEER